MKVPFIAFLTALSIAGCVTPKPVAEPRPIDAFQAYQRSLAQGDPQGAYKFLGVELKKELSLATFQRLFDTHGEAMQAEALSLLEKMRNQSPREEVWVSVGKHRAHLVRTPDGWRLTGVLGTIPGEEKAPKHTP